ncbi:uncharacterized protein MYCFIDRAFT_27369 [Pseudocercospora fijiensis CIRAD86]|uniref:C2H2-type domain-containing protein n=1 Tax=Pseudocercospora fijiensis (strain CIRAD86) TaxID=383855 RepID=N1QCX6_PSEFD|nr:uncharacterized protein MYCFIDRAFT_27369 [Pseudocercospora fijiensis CIRAD86]EME89438.1 hypothetical protein MYCFIDRAFT_27369 [Pseudocercospora fijiensis CIRAD86]
MAHSPAKRKRGAPISTPLGELYVDISPRKKRVRYDDDVDDASSFAASHVPSSFAESDTAATATIADTETPLTEASSVRSKSQPRAKRYQCSFEGCTKAFDRPIRLQAHFNTHTGERPYACSEDGCDKSFYKIEHLNRHVKDKHGSSTFICEFEVYNDQTQSRAPCGLAFPSASKLKRHIARHQGKEETTCSWDGCGKVFRRQETLQRHIKKDHLGEESYLCKRELPDGEICGQAFATPGQLRGHEARVHEAPKYWCEDMFDSLTLSEPTPAQTPSVHIVSFPTYHDLQRHNTLVHPPKCAQCGKKCRSAKDLSAHMDIVHSGDPDVAAAAKPPKRFVCPYEGCTRSSLDFGFSKKGNVDQHIKSAHTKERKFVCGEFDLSGCSKTEGWNGIGCGLAVVTKQALIGHVRTQHMGLKPTNLKSKGAKKDSKKIAPKTDLEIDIEMDDVPPATEHNKTLSLITGYGYEQQRPFACLLAPSRGCQMRFTKEHELGYHMEMTHGWHVDDVEEALNDPDIHAEDTDIADQILKRRLETEMNAVGAAFLDPQFQPMQA